MAVSRRLVGDERYSPSRSSRSTSSSIQAMPGFRPGTRTGARVGDLFMSLIYTAELCGVNPFDYLVALQRHADAVADSPARWMPWHYAAALAEITAPASATGPAP